MTPSATPVRASAVLLLFAAAREAAGVAREEVVAGSVGEAIEEARYRHGARFAEILDRSRVWLNGEPAELSQSLADGDEIAVLPPVSGGAATSA